MPLVPEEQEQRQHEPEQRINRPEDRAIRHKIWRNEPDEILDDKPEDRDRHGKTPRQCAAEGHGPHGEEQSVDSNEQRRVLTHKDSYEAQIMSKNLRVMQKTCCVLITMYNRAIRKRGFL